MDEILEEKIHLLKDATAALLNYKRKLLAVRDVECMTLKECCTILDDWKNTDKKLKISVLHISTLFSDPEDVNNIVYKQWESCMNIKQIFEDISKLIKLLDKKKKSFGLVLKGKFGTNVQSLLSEFKYTAKEFDVKDLNQAQVDLHYLKGDLTSKGAFLLKFFDV